MGRPSRVELYAAIRRDARAGMSGRELQRHHGVGWRDIMLHGDWESCSRAEADRIIR